MVHKLNCLQSKDATVRQLLDFRSSKLSVNQCKSQLVNHNLRIAMIHKLLDSQLVIRRLLFGFDCLPSEHLRGI